MAFTIYWRTQPVNTILLGQWCTNFNGLKTRKVVTLDINATYKNITKNNNNEVHVKD